MSLVREKNEKKFLFCAFLFLLHHPKIEFIRERELSFVSPQNMEVLREKMSYNSWQRLSFNL